MAFKIVAAAALLATARAVAVTSTDIETITSCGPEVTDCPAKSSTPAAVVVTSTDIETITSCGPEVTDCPAKKKSSSSAPVYANTTSCVTALNSTVAPAVTSAPVIVTSAPVVSTKVCTECAEGTTLVTVWQGETITVVGTSAPAVIPPAANSTGVQLANGAGSIAVGGSFLAAAVGALLL